MAEQTFREAVEEKIKKSSSLIEALESVGAMYGIPAENIVVDDRLNGIRVQGDMVLAPDRPNPSVNTKSIVCAIGAVLDNISQRIDDKLNAFQADQIKKNEKLASQKTPNPSKGEVVGRFYDDNGGEIIAYSSGLVDMDSTPEASKKVAELRASKQIPDIVSEPDKDVSGSSSYFTNEDDIMNNVPLTDTMKADLSRAETNVAKQIHESAQMLDLFNEFDESRTMGYDLLQSQGFDFVKPTNVIIQEAETLTATMSSDSSSDAKETVSMSNIQHMKFDNTKILEAIKLFNEAFDKIYKDKVDVQHVNPRMVMKTREWKEAVHDLEYQFNCTLDIEWRDNPDENMYTTFDPYKARPRLKISKSKGFQLSHMPIRIVIVGTMMDSFIKKRDRSLFGQSLISVFLHEIFHNIVQMIRQYDYSFIATMSTTMMLATSTRSVKARRIIFTNYVNSLQTIDGKKPSMLAKKKMVRELLYISSVQYNEKLIEELKSSISKEKLSKDVVEDYIKKINEVIKYQDKIMNRNKKPLMKVFNTICVIAGILTFWMGIGFIFFAIWGHNGFGITPESFEKRMKEYLNSPDKEEYYCDLFAGIYNLPVSFFLAGKKISTGVTPKEIDDPELLKKLTEAEKQLSQRCFSTYPTDEERNYASLQIAKNVLNSGIELDPSIKKYLEWIVDNYKNLDESGIKDNYNQAAFNPQEAENLDDHIQRIIDTGNVKVVEQYTPRISRLSRFSS